MSSLKFIVACKHFFHVVSTVQLFRIILSKPIFLELYKSKVEKYQTIVQMAEDRSNWAKRGFAIGFVEVGAQSEQEFLLVLIKLR